MTPRLDVRTTAPEVYKGWFSYSVEVEQSGLEQSLLELVKARVSQINGCANCLNIHTHDARAAGETEQRLHLLAAWADAPCYSERERVALAWVEHLTLIAERRAPDAVYAALDAQFDKDEQVKLTMAINVINGWNRIAIAFNMFIPEMGWQ